MFRLLRLKKRIVTWRGWHGLALKFQGPVLFTYRDLLNSPNSILEADIYVTLDLPDHMPQTTEKLVQSLDLLQKLLLF